MGGKAEGGSKPRWYETRDRSLAEMGYATYADYLKSPLWGTIRSRVLSRCRRVCEACGSAPATQVHHRSYCPDAMRGKRDDFLVACCRPCHEAAEFDAGRKVPPTEANHRMTRAAFRGGRVLFGLCRGCRKNPTRRDATMCGRCVRDGVQPVV